MGGLGEDLHGRTLLHHPPGVHHGNAVGEVGDDREVVGDVQGSDAVLAAERAHGVQHVGLGGHVQPGRRLVEHDQRRAAGEGHRQPDSLLLATGELMWVALQKLRRPGEQHLAHHLGHPIAAGRVIVAELVGVEDLPDLLADADRRVQRRSRILGDIADDGAAQLAQ